MLKCARPIHNLKRAKIPQADKTLYLLVFESGKGKLMQKFGAKFFNFGVLAKTHQELRSAKI